VRVRCIIRQINLFDMDMKYADVLPLAEVLDQLRRRPAR